MRAPRSTLRLVASDQREDRWLAFSEPVAMTVLSYDAMRLVPPGWLLLLSLLATLSRETGKPIPTLIAEALEELQSHVHRGRDRNGDAATHQHAARTASVLEIFQEAREGIPEETWQALPQDLAAQHDHYIYGTPKHPS